jgi:hypothetical protein
MSEPNGDRALGDFLLDESISPSAPQEMAARALSELCRGDRGKVDRAICNGVIQFLDATCNPPPEDPDRARRLIDLVSLVGELQTVRGVAMYHELLRWANVWHS